MVREPLVLRGYQRVGNTLVTSVLKAVKRDASDFEVCCVINVISF